MKKIILFSLMTIILSVPTVGTAGFYGPKHNLKERMITMRNWKLMEEFSLSEEEAHKVFSILKQYDDEMEMLIKKRRRLISALRKELRKEMPSDEKLRETMAELAKVNVELAKIPEKQVKGLSTVFDVKEQAKFIIFSQQIVKEMRAMIEKEHYKRKGRNGPPPPPR